MLLFTFLSIIKITWPRNLSAVLFRIPRSQSSPRRTTLPRLHHCVHDKIMLLAEWQQWFIIYMVVVLSPFPDEDFTEGRPWTLAFKLFTTVCIVRCSYNSSYQLRAVQLRKVVILFLKEHRQGSVDPLLRGFESQVLRIPSIETPIRGFTNNTFPAS